MNLTDKKYQLLMSVGLILLFLTTLLDRYLKNNILNGLIVGFAVGWLCATWLLRLLIAKEQEHKARLEGKKILQEIKEEFKI